MQAQTDGWICRQLQAITLCTPPKFERKVLDNGELNSAIFVDTRSSQPFLPPSVFVYLMNDSGNRPLRKWMTLRGEEGEVVFDWMTGRLPCGLEYGSFQRAFDKQGVRIHERSWLVSAGETNRIEVVGAAYEADWSDFEPTLSRIVRTLGFGGEPIVEAVPARTFTDEQILKLVFQLHGNNGEIIEGLNTIANERAVVWVRMCQLWAAAKESRDPTADYFEEALMIIAMVDETVSNLDQFASDQLKTAELHPSMLNVVVSVLVTKPSSDELKPVLDGLHAISRRVAPGTIHSLMAVYNDAPGDRAKDVAAHGIQAWLAGKHLILRDEARKNGGVVNVSHPTLAAAVTEIVAGGDIARNQMTSALQRVDQVLRDGSPDDRLNAEAERAVMLHVLERIPR